MLDTTLKLPQYRSHKVVSALKILAVNGYDAKAYDQIGEILEKEMRRVAEVTIVPVEEGYAAFLVSGDYYRKHKPRPGGYYVQYEDGYQSYSPAEAFESGYTPVSG